MRCFVELNHSPFSPILCRCTSCRDDVVTMAAKPRRRRREERDGERKNRRKQIQNQIQRRRKKEDREEKKGGERKTERGPEEMLMWEPTLWSPLLSLHEATDLSVFESASCRSTSAPHQSHSSSVWFANSNGDYDLWWRYEDLTALWRCRRHLLNHLTPIISCIKNNFPLHPTTESNSEDTRLFSLIGLFAGTLLNVNFAKGVCVRVGDFSILFGLVPSCRVCHPSPDVRCNWFERVCPLFLHFSVLHRH